MNRKKILAAGTAAVMAFTVGAVYVGSSYFQSDSVVHAESKKEDVDFLKNLTEKNAGVDKEETKGIYKDESVYVMAGADGSYKEITVTDWLKNAGDQKELKDYSELKDIQNVKGNEKFIRSGSDLTWNTDNADIYYQGTTDKELPITEKITYKLNGREIEVKELKGKSGKLTMTISFENHSKRTVKIDGKDEEVYTPFTMVSGIILPEENFSHVTVENGKIFSDASRKVVAGMAFPGLKESLGLEGEDVDIPDTITITADVEKFKIGPTLTLATTEVMSQFGLEDVNSFDDLKDALDKMSDASGQLVDGSKALSEGLDTLQSKTGTLKTGISALTAGMGDLENGSDKLNSGVSQYTKGADQLAEGVNQYVDGTTEFAKGVDQYTAATGKLAGGMQDISAGVNKAKAGSGKLVKAGAELKAGLKQADAGIAGTKKELQDMGATLKGVYQYLAAEAQDGTKTPEERQKAQAEAQKVGAILQKLQAQSSQSGSQNVSLEKTFDAYYSGVKDLDKGLGDFKGQVDKAGSQLGGLPAAQKQLKEASVELKSKGKLLKSKEAELTGKSGELRSGASDLSSGASKLSGGGNTLAQGGDALIQGIGELANGGRDLKSGMEEFDRGAIEKLSNVFDGNIKSLMDRLDAMKSLADDYKSYAGAPDSMPGSVKFIIETEEVE